MKTACLGLDVPRRLWGERGQRCGVLAVLGVLAHHDIEHGIDRIVAGGSAEGDRLGAQHAVIPGCDLYRGDSASGPGVVGDGDSIGTLLQPCRIAGCIVVLGSVGDGIVHIEIAAGAAHVAVVDVRA